MTGQKWIQLIEKRRNEFHQAINMMLEEIPESEWQAYEILLYEDGRIILQRYAFTNTYDKRWLNGKAVSFLRIYTKDYKEDGKALLYIKEHADDYIENAIDFIRDKEIIED